MNESEFHQWLDIRNVPESVRSDLRLAVSHVDQDTMAGQMVDDFAGIVEYTDYAIFEMSPHDAGFVVFGSCPNGDPIAIDISNEIGRIVYLSHEEIDENGFPDQKVAVSMEQFLQQVNDDKLPLDYHEAIRWGTGDPNAG